LRTAPGAVRFAVRVTPRGGRDAIGAWAADSAGQPYLPVRVKVAAEDGKANEAVLALLKEALQVRRDALRIASGARGRVKLIEVAGDAAALEARLDEIGKKT
jgi:uncharacterized protein YggU (UPF0235/DUF167 family)